MTKENAYAIVQAARSAGKVTGLEIINQLFDNFFELHGDRNGTDDPAIIGGLATDHHRPWEDGWSTGCQALWEPGTWWLPEGPALN